MHARVTTVHGDAANLDKAIAHVEGTSLPAVRKLDGFKGILYLVNRSTGQGVAVTLWDSEAALRAGDEAAKQIRSEAVAVASGGVDDVSEYEVVIQEMA